MQTTTNHEQRNKTRYILCYFEYILKVFLFFFPLINRIDKNIQLLIQNNRHMIILFFYSLNSFILKIFLNVILKKKTYILYLTLLFFILNFNL